jgi:hypothetical protein
MKITYLLAAHWRTRFTGAPLELQLVLRMFVSNKDSSRSLDIPAAFSSLCKRY